MSCAVLSLMNVTMVGIGDIGRLVDAKPCDRSEGCCSS